MTLYSKCKTAYNSFKIINYHLVSSCDFACEVQRTGSYSYEQTDSAKTIWLLWTDIGKSFTSLRINGEYSMVVECGI